MTDLARDINATKRLTKRLREKCKEPRLRVSRIRPTAPERSSVEVEVQLDLNDSSFQLFKPVSITLEPSLGVGQGRSCLDNKVIDAIGDAFLCERLQLKD